MNYNKLRIGLDIDDTLVSFMDHYIKRFGYPKNDYDIAKKLQRVLKKDKKWWLNQPLLRRPDFNVTLYCTKRIHSKNWTKQQIQLHNLPKAPVYQVYSQGKNKADVIKGRVDVFIDDSISNFEAMNKSGLPCLLIDSPYNRHFQTEARIYSLNYKEIEETYNRLFNE